MTLTAEQRAKAKKRYVSVDAASVNTEERTFTVAIASETPCISVYEIKGKKVEVLETLQIAPLSVNFDRLLNSGPVLFNHNADNLIGVFESVWIDPDRVIRARVRIGPGALADQCLAQIKAGVLTKFSIGFWIDDWKDDGVDRVTGMKRVLVTHLTIFEGSFVAIPADDTVGVNRSLSGSTDTASNTEKQISPEPTPAAAAAPVPDARAINSTDTGTENKTRHHMNRKEINAKIRSLVAKYSGLVRDAAALRSFADSAIDSGEQTDADVQDYINSNLAERSIETSTVSVPTPGKVRSEILAAVRSVNTGSKASFNLSYKRSVIDGSATHGAELVQTELMPVIDALTEKDTVLAHVQKLIGVTGNIKYPRITGDLVAGSAQKGDSLKETTLLTGDVDLSEKRFGFYFDVDRSVFAKVPGIGALLERLCYRALAKKLGRAIISGDAEVGAVGLLDTDGVAEVTFSNTGITWDKTTEFLGKVELADYDHTTCGWLINPMSMAKAMSVQKANGQGFIMEDGRIAGFEAAVSNQVGTSGRVIFGDRSQIVLALYGDGMDITLDPLTLRKEGKVRVVCDVLADFAILQPAAFAISTNSAVNGGGKASS